MKKRSLDHSLKSIARASFIVFIAMFISKILGYVYRAVMARYFNPEVYGLFSLAVMISGWFIAIGALGFTEGIVRYLSVYRAHNEVKKAKFLVQRTIVVLSVSSVLGAILLFAFSNIIAINIFHDVALSSHLRIFSFVIPFAVLIGIWYGILRAFERIPEFSFAANVAPNFFRLIVLVLLILIGTSALGISYSYLISSILLFLVAYFICIWKVPQIFGKYSLPASEKKAIMREYVAYSWPLMLSGFFLNIFYWLDSFTIGYFKDAFAVGIYNAAVPLALLLFLAPELFMQLFFPLVAQEYAKKNLTLVRETSKQVGKWIFTFNIPLFIILVLFPEQIIRIVFGGDYLAAASALRFIAIGTFINSVTFTAFNLITIIGKSRLVMYNLLVSLGINAFLNILLVPLPGKYGGIVGASIATMISYIVLSLLVMIETYKFLNLIPFRRKILRISIVGGISGVIVLFVKNMYGFDGTMQFIALMGMFYVLYILLLIVTRCLDVHDFSIVAAIKNKISKST